MAHGKPLRRVLLVAVLMVASGAAPPTKPATRPAAALTSAPPLSPEESARTREAFNDLLQRGTDAILAREYAVAQELLFDARQLFERRMRGVSAAPLGSPEHVAVLHGLAQAYLLGGAPEKAAALFNEGTTLDRACAAKTAPRLLLLTRAYLDLVDGRLVMRTAVGMSNYLKAHPDELDAEFLDVLCTAIVAADEQVAARGTLNAVIDVYEPFSQRLEATRPGQRRWGVQWVPEGDFNQRLEERNQTIARYNDALRAVPGALKDAHRATKRLWDAQVSGRNKTTAGIRLDGAKAKLREYEDYAEKLRQSIPPIPGLTRDDLLRIVTPHPVDVLVVPAAPPPPTPSAKAAPPAPTRSAPASAATPKVKTIPSGLGLGGVAARDNSTARAPAAVPLEFSRSAVAFAVGPEILITAASAVRGASRVMVDLPEGQSIEAIVERTNGDDLALLRIRGQQLAYLNPAAKPFAGGPITCPAFPNVDITRSAPESIDGKAPAPQETGWKVLLTRHPRLAGAPLLDAAGDLVGVAVGERADPPERLPAQPLSEIRRFLDVSAPKEPCPTPKAAVIVRATGIFER